MAPYLDALKLGKLGITQIKVILIWGNRAIILIIKLSDKKKEIVSEEAFLFSFTNGFTKPTFV